MQAYLIMVLADTSFSLYCKDRSFEWLRYAAWGTVAPITIAYIGVLAQAATTDIIYTAVLSFLSVLALFAAATSPVCIASWPLLAFAVLAGIIVITHLRGNFQAAAKANLPGDVSRLYSVYITGFILTFFGYVVVWGVSEGGKVTTPTQEIITYTVLDILTKVVLNAFLLLGITSYHQYGSAFAFLGTESLDISLNTKRQ
jgi:bacteriorhodopsin